MARRALLKWGVRLFGIITIAILVVTKFSSNAFCSESEFTKRLLSPTGGWKTKFSIDISVRSFANLSKVCGYQGAKLVCPDVRRYGETVLRQAQLSIIRMVRVMDLISRRHDFNFWLCSGSLLGAMRHQGIIPWDNDADICMVREDYNKFLKWGASDLPTDIFLQNSKNDPEFRKAMANDAKLRDNLGCYGRCIRRGCKFHDGYQVDIFVFDIQKDNHLRDSYKRFDVKYDAVFPLEELSFEGFRVPVPKDRLTLLMDEYGADVMQLPPPASRCPPVGMIGVPWYSCKEIELMPTLLQTSILRESFLSNAGFVSIFWYLK